MPDPQVETLIDLSALYHATPAGHERREFDRSSAPEWLRKSLNKCHDINKAVIKENIRLREENRRQWIWIKVLGGALTVAWGLVLALLAVLLSSW